jgi:uncharacterized protein YqeY
MSLLEKIKGDYLVARKEKDESVKWLSTLISEIEIYGKTNGNRVTTDAEAIKIIQKFKKNVEATCNLMSDSGADSKELEQYIDEISVYDLYLPKMLTENEITNIVINFTNEDKDNLKFPKIMSFLKENYNGEYNGKIAAKVIKGIL